MSTYKKQQEAISKLTPEQYRVTQQAATEMPGTGEHLHNTAPGIYVDVVSGEPLFASSDKYDSGSGWPSFTRPVQSDNVNQRPDPREGGTEVRSVHGDSHLGHIFSDGPSATGGLRYCINSAALRFVDRDDMEHQGYASYLNRVDEDYNAGHQAVEPFRVSIATEVLDDLRLRLSRTRWPDEFGNEDWRYGTSTEYLKEVVTYWIESFDWRKQEEAMNSFPQFLTEIDGMPIHFIHVRGKGPKPKPLILSHGWPWTFWEYRKVIGPLSDPAQYGGDPDDSFDVVIPSLPGHGFSTPLREEGINFWRTSELWVKLMERLGYQRFGAHGADWGALVTADLGHRFAERMMGVHFPMLLPLDLFSGGLPAPDDYDADEAPIAARLQNFFATESAYSALQSTKPQTIAAALNDSPVGLASWMIEKMRGWSDCHGDLETRFSKDDLLTTIMIYWVTQSYGTSARYYYAAAHNPWTPVHDRTPVVEAPVGISVFPEEVCSAPRRWTQRYYNLKQRRDHASGGHFGAWEEPQAIVADLRDFFRNLT